MQLIDEKNDLPFLLGEVVEHGLQALLELAAELRAGDERAEIEREDALGLETFRNLAVDDALGEALDDRGLADTGLADEHRVVLGAPLQHLHGPANLVVAPDDGIELALRGPIGQVDGVSVERLARVLGVRVLDRRAAGRSSSMAFSTAPLTAPASSSSPASGPPRLQGREDEQLARNVGIAALLRELVCDVEKLAEGVGDVQLAACPLDRRQPFKRLAEPRAQARSS